MKTVIQRIYILFIMLLVVTALAVSQQCKATLKNGTQCKKKVQAGSIYCRQHTRIYGTGAAKSISPAKTKSTTPAKTESTSPAKTEPTSPTKTEPTSPTKTEPTAPAKTEPISPAETEPTSPAKTAE
jgi:hypothetical protein